MIDLNALLTALALFPASCGVTTHNNTPQVVPHTSGGWHITACVFTKPGYAQTGYAHVITPPPQPCTPLPIRKFPNFQNKP